MRNKTFRFPAVSYIYDSENETDGASLITEISDNLIYPVLPDISMQIDIDLE